MYNSDIAVYSKEIDYYLDISKFAKLGMWIAQLLGSEIDDAQEFIESLIGEVPTLQEKRQLTEDDIELINFAKKSNLNYKITSKGIKITK